EHHLRAAGDSRDRAEPAPGAAGAVRLAGGRENRDAGRDRRGARLLDDPGGADPRPVEGSGVSLPWSLQCSACGKTRSADGLPTVCECGGPTAGNAGVALAAYAARAGVPARVYAPASTPPTILSQIRSYGGDLVLLDGHIGDCGAAARAYAAASGAVDVSTLREPYRIEG